MTGVISSFGDALPYAGSLLFGLDGSGTGGLCLNILITLAVLPASLVLGSLLGAVRLFRVRPLNWLAFLFIEAVKGIPVLLMIFWLHYALPAFLGLRPPLFLTAVAALTMYGSANVAEVFLSGADMVRKSELEAARLSGFSGAGVFRRVLAPQVLRRMVPALLGVMVSLSDTDGHDPREPLSGHARAHVCPHRRGVHDCLPAARETRESHRAQAG